VRRPWGWGPLCRFAACDFLQNAVDCLLCELLEEIRAAVEIELADERGLHATVAPVLTLGEVLSKGEPRNVGEIGHRHDLDRSSSRVSHDRSFEHPSNERCGRLDYSELEQHLNHLRADHFDVICGELYAVNSRNLRDHLELHCPGRHEVEGWNWVRENRG